MFQTRENTNLFPPSTSYPFSSDVGCIFSFDELLGETQIGQAGMARCQKRMKDFTTLVHDTIGNELKRSGIIHHYEKNLKPFDKYLDRYNARSILNDLNSIVHPKWQFSSNSDLQLTPVTFAYLDDLRVSTKVVKLCRKNFMFNFPCVVFFELCEDDNFESLRDSYWRFFIHAYYLKKHYIRASDLSRKLKESFGYDNNQRVNAGMLRFYWIQIIDKKIQKSEKRLNYMQFTVKKNKMFGAEFCSWFDNVSRYRLYFERNEVEKGYANQQLELRRKRNEEQKQSKIAKTKREQDKIQHKNRSEKSADTKNVDLPIFRKARKSALNRDLNIESNRSKKIKKNSRYRNPISATGLRANK